MLPIKHLKILFISIISKSLHITLTNVYRCVGRVERHAGAARPAARARRVRLQPARAAAAARAAPRRRRARAAQQVQTTRLMP